MSEFPTKEERTQCWNNKDRYWECLDKNAPTHSTTGGDAEPKACLELRKAFEKSCPGQWVKHFDRKRSYELFKRRMESGYDPLDKSAKS
ncbi:cytochrome c oxidase assembly factor 6 homolog [Lutzomyia longipalpis]|uniref:cytochrome c oxidase assembly factor 6 homolog n=1 Tax=Lutzomyia longipalpis TaxID=7200 RepID=UPI00248456B9|nr:cytochrome c oxidase assembly factor 6 homolog [Lutzomyia longipalpis]